MVLAMFAGTSALAQDVVKNKVAKMPETKENKELKDRTKMTYRGGGMVGGWIERRLLSKEFMAQAGISPEQAEKMKSALSELEKKNGALELEITAQARQQIELIKKTLLTPEGNADELMALVETIGKLRTEQAKVMTQRIVTIREHLTADQRKKIMALLAEDQKLLKGAREHRENRDTAKKDPTRPRPAVPQGW